jgi:hypothetical protein
MQPKSIFASKTFWLNLIGSLAIILQDPGAMALLPPGWTPRLVGILALLNVINRLLTNGPSSITAPLSGTGDGSVKPRLWIIALLLPATLLVSACTQTKPPVVPGVDPAIVQFRINVSRVFDGVTMAATTVKGAYDVAKVVSAPANVTEAIRVNGLRFGCAVQFAKYTADMAACAAAGMPTLHVLDSIQVAANTASLKALAKQVLELIKPVLDGLAADPRFASIIATLNTALEAVRLLGGGQ